jgi:hypothetical protein
LCEFAGNPLKLEFGCSPPTALILCRPEAAARKLIEIANLVEAVQDGRIATVK